MDKRGNSVLENIKANYEKLFSAEKKAAAYILANPEQAIMMNISELARKSGSSEATVVRMCKHVGYQGYYQMRLLMSHDLGKARPTYDENEMLVKAVRLLRLSRMVFVVAAGNTSPIATDLGFRLERCGIPCSYSMIPEHFLNHVSLGTSDDTIVAISRSGASKQVVQAMELAMKKQMHSIVITGEKDTQLAEHADCVIQIVDKKKQALDTEPDSHLLEMAVSDALLYINRHFDALTQNAKDDNKEAGYGDDVELLLSEYKL